MTTIKCKECQTCLSLKEENCPNCGFQIPPSLPLFHLKLAVPKYFTITDFELFSDWLENDKTVIVRTKNPDVFQALESSGYSPVTYFIYGLEINWSNQRRSHEIGILQFTYHDEDSDESFHFFCYFWGKELKEDTKIYPIEPPIVNEELIIPHYHPWTGQDVFVETGHEKHRGKQES